MSVILVLAITAMVMTVCAYFVGKYLTLARVWGCMVKSFGEEGADPLSRDALEHHQVISDLIKRI